MLGFIKLFYTRLIIEKKAPIGQRPFGLFDCIERFRHISQKNTFVHFAPLRWTSAKMKLLRTIV